MQLLHLWRAAATLWESQVKMLHKRRRLHRVDSYSHHEYQTYCPPSILHIC